MFSFLPNPPSSQIYFSCQLTTIKFQHRVHDLCKPLPSCFSLLEFSCDFMASTLSYFSVSFSHLPPSNRRAHTHTYIHHSCTQLTPRYVRPWLICFLCEVSNSSSLPASLCPNPFTPLLPAYSYFYRTKVCHYPTLKSSIILHCP